jgi:hypothetical protein
VRRAYSIYLLSGTIVCAIVGVVALVTGQYLWIIVGAGGSVSCLWGFLRRRRAQANVLPNKSAIARWREHKEHRAL